MNRGHVLESLPFQQMMASGRPNWWNLNNMRPPPQSSSSSSFLSPYPNLLPQLLPTSLLPSSSSSSSLPLSSSWQAEHPELPESWSQLLLGGLMSEEEKSGMSHHMQVKKLEEWEEQLALHQAANAASAVHDVKQENSANSYGYGHGNVEFNQAAAATNWPSPRSCLTSLSSNMLDFSSKKADARHPPPDHSSECNSIANGGASKKARVQPSSTQATFKVRKEKLGDRITALHQLVSPFGKTDTASVLLEAIGYIRFLQSQIEALSLPYLGSGSGNNMRQKHPVQGDKNCLFPEEPASVQDGSEEPKKDLRSRGLCLVPISCTLQVGNDNGADYWAPALGGGFR